MNKTPLTDALDVSLYPGKLDDAMVAYQSHARQLETALRLAVQSIAGSEDDVYIDFFVDRYVKRAKAKEEGK